MTTCMGHCCVSAYGLHHQVLSTLGNVQGKRVLELGAGIGRFTGELAKMGK